MSLSIECRTFPECLDKIARFVKASADETQCLKVFREINTNCQCNAKYKAVLTMAAIITFWSHAHADSANLAQHFAALSRLRAQHTSESEARFLSLLPPQQSDALFELNRFSACCDFLKQLQIYQSHERVMFNALLTAINEERLREIDAFAQIDYSDDWHTIVQSIKAKQDGQKILEEITERYAAACDTDFEPISLLITSTLMLDQPKFAECHAGYINDWLKFIFRPESFLFRQLLDRISEISDHGKFKQILGWFFKLKEISVNFANIRQVKLAVNRVDNFADQPGSIPIPVLKGVKLSLYYRHWIKRVLSLAHEMQPSTDQVDRQALAALSVELAQQLDEKKILLVEFLLISAFLCLGISLDGDTVSQSISALWKDWITSAEVQALQRIFSLRLNRPKAALYDHYVTLLHQHLEAVTTPVRSLNLPLKTLTAVAFTKEYRTSEALVNSVEVKNYFRAFWLKLQQAYLGCNMTLTEFLFLKTWIVHQICQWLRSSSLYNPAMKRAFVSITSTNYSSTLEKLKESSKDLAIPEMVELTKQLEQHIQRNQPSSILVEASQGRDYVIDVERKEMAELVTLCMNGDEAIFDKAFVGGMLTFMAHNQQLREIGAREFGVLLIHVFYRYFRTRRYRCSANGSVYLYLLQRIASFIKHKTLKSLLSITHIQRHFSMKNIKPSEECFMRILRDMVLHEVQPQRAFEPSYEIAVFIGDLKAELELDSSGDGMAWPDLVTPRARELQETIDGICTEDTLKWEDALKIFDAIDETKADLKEEEFRHLCVYTTFMFLMNDEALEPMPVSRRSYWEQAREQLEDYFLDKKASKRRQFLQTIPLETDHLANLVYVCFTEGNGYIHDIPFGVEGASMIIGKLKK